MFTGMIQKLGTVVNLQREGLAGRLVLSCPPWEREFESGESIAVNGVCLSLVDFTDDRLSFDVLAETFSRTNLGQKQPGDLLNLERALRYGDPLSGHLVTGHVDEAGEVVTVEPTGRDWKLRVRTSSSFLPYLVHKGSICLDGISLTVAVLEPDGFWVHLIPITWTETAVHRLRAGDQVNLEADLAGKYALRGKELSWKQIESAPEQARLPKPEPE